MLTPDRVKRGQVAFSHPSNVASRGVVQALDVSLSKSVSRASLPLHPVMARQTDNLVHVWINGRYLTRPTTGVERVAHGLVTALAEHFLRDDASVIFGETTLRFCIAVPKGFEAQVPANVGCIPVVAVGMHQGHLWEQLDLARLPAADWLVSLCNTGPILRRQHGLMLHDAQIYATPDNFNWKFRLWYRLLFNLAGRRAAFLLTNSSFSQAEIARYTGPFVMNADAKRMLLDGLDEAFDKKSWHGPNLRGAMRGVTAVPASWRPAGDRHNIWELTLHAAYWKYVVRRKILREKRGSFVLEGSNFFERPESGAARCCSWASTFRTC